MPVKASRHRALPRSLAVVPNYTTPSQLINAEAVAEKPNKEQRERCKYSTLNFNSS